MYAARRWSVRHARGLRSVYQTLARLAPWLAPLVRLLGRAGAEAVARPVERAIKGFLFDCRMCGECVLSGTGMACPMNCAKQMRNGPCGGVRADGGCEVDPQVRCVWLEAMDGAKRIGLSVKEGGALLRPLDHAREGRSSWVPVILSEPPRAEPPRGGAPITHEPGPLERACQSGRFVVTVELAPPDSANPAGFLARADHFENLVDAINLTDGAGGNCHMSSVAASAILAANGHTPIYQVVCRDRNRIAIQGDILGAAALGVRNILCLTGDDVSQGDQPQAKPVFDLDATTLLGIARGMRDAGTFASGRRLEHAPDFFLGATVNPFVPPHAGRIANLENKVAAGARFIQTQFCFDVGRMEAFMRAVRERGLHRRCTILAGVGTLGNAKALQRMAEKVPGVHVPRELLERIGRAADPRAESKRAAIGIIRALSQIEGVGGFHFMGHRNESTLAEIIVESGLRRCGRAPAAATGG